MKENLISLLLLCFLSLSKLSALEEIYYFEDTSNRLSIHEVVEKSEQFQKLPSPNAAFGVTDSTFWLTFNVTNDTDRTQIKFITLKPSFTQQITLYEIGKSIKISASGSRIKLRDRAIHSSNMVFKTTLAPHQSKRFYLACKTPNSLLISINILDETQFASFMTFDQVFFAMMVGILILALSYNLFFYFFLQENVFIIYVAFITIQLVYVFLYSANILYFVDHFPFYAHAFLISQFVATLFFILLLQNFFHTQERFPHFERLFNAANIAIVIFIVIALFDLSLAYQIKALFIFLLPPLFISFFWHQRKSIDLLLISGWIIYFLVTLYIILVYSNTITLGNDNYYLIHYTYYIGIMPEAILFSLALSHTFYRTKEEKIRLLQESRHKNKILQFKHKISTLGEMYGNIEHQWRTPMAAINGTLLALYIEVEKNKKICTLSKQKLFEKIDQCEEHILDMSKTMSDFKSFYQEDTQQTTFLVKTAIDKAITIVKHLFEYHHIEIDFKREENIELDGYPNELAQILLNFFSNAYRAFIKNHIDHPKLTIELRREEERVIILITDNAGGIDKAIIDKIFDPLFSTHQSSGLGLYMSKTIVEEKMHGLLRIKNFKNGVQVKLVL